MNSREKIVQCFHFLFSKKTEFYQFFFQIGTISFVRVCSTGTADNGKMLGEAFPVMYLYQGRYTYADYGDMGQSKRYFTSDVPAVNYLPAYLSKMVAYPVDGDARVVVYRYYNGTDLKIYSDEYTYSAEKARWELNTRIVDKTEQFVLSDGKWNFDPSTVVTLKAEKGDAETAAFYQTITDWVIANKGQEYAPIFSGKSNNEYYYGSSAYQNNFDFRPAKWREQNAAAYGNMSDADLTKLMFERLPEAFLPGLKAIYGSADVVEGVDVFYTINFAIYDGSSTTQYTIKYKVTGKGQFEYVADSLKKVE